MPTKTLAKNVIENSSTLGTCFSGATILTCLTQVVENYISLFSLGLAILSFIVSLIFYFLNYSLRRKEFKRREQETVLLKRKVRDESARRKPKVKR